MSARRGWRTWYFLLRLSANPFHEEVREIELPCTCLDPTKRPDLVARMACPPIDKRFWEVVEVVPA